MTTRRGRTQRCEPKGERGGSTTAPNVNSNESRLSSAEKREAGSAERCRRAVVAPYPPLRMG